jgi:bile acid:Na+ symporter, BASS family
MLITLLPVAAGMVLHRYAPSVATRLARWLRPTALIVLIAVIAFSVWVSREMVLRNVARGGPSIWVLNVVATLTGVAIGRLIRANARDSMTLGIEVGVHNVTLALYVTLTVLGSLPLAVLQNVYGVVMLINAGILIRWFRPRVLAEEGKGT